MKYQQWRKALARRAAPVMLLGGVVGFVVPAGAQNPAEARGLEIAIESDRRDQGFGDQVAELTMTLRVRPR